MGELIIGWAEQTRTEQSVASECMLTQILMALTSLSAMQLHNDTKKPWPEMVTREVEQMNTELLYSQIKNLTKYFFSFTNENWVWKEEEKCCYGNMIYVI